MKPERTTTSAAAVWTRALDRVQDALARAAASRKASQYAAAIDAYREAIDARGEDAATNEAWANEIADARIKIAECQIELGAMEAAQRSLADAAAGNEGRLRPSVLGALHVARGYIALNRARYEETVGEATSAWNALRATGENTLLSRALCCRGHGLRRLGRLEEASRRARSTAAPWRFTRRAEARRI
jgi:hypothetical protein